MLKPVYCFSIALVILTVTTQTLAQSPVHAPDPDPLRFESEMALFSQWDHKNSFPEKAILFTGSSSIRGWDTHLAFPEYPVINRGFGGSHISDVNYHYQRVIGKYEPALIVFYAGDNDINANKPVEQVFEDYKQLAERVLTGNSEIRLLFLSIKPSASRWEYWEKMDELNQRVSEYSQTESRLYYVDLATPLLDSGGRPDGSFYLEDRLHLSEQGYKIWNNVLGPELANLFEKR